MPFSSGKFTSSAAAAIALTAMMLGLAPAYAQDEEGDHASRLSHLVDRLQTGSIDSSEGAEPGTPSEKPCVFSGHADADLNRNSDMLKGLCVEIVRFSENDVAWTLQRISSGRPGPLWTVFHDDGDAAYSAALYGVKRYGGTMIAIEAGEHALHAGLDPETLFGTVGQDKGGRSWPRYGALFMYEALQAQAVISLRSSAVLTPGKSTDLLMAGMDSGVVEHIRTNRSSAGGVTNITWLDDADETAMSAFANRVLTVKPLPYFRVETSGEMPAPCMEMVDIIASAAKLPALASSNHHYSAEGEFNTY